jgi:hypothetical protein
MKEYRRLSVATLCLAGCLLAAAPLAAQSYEGTGRDPAKFDKGLSNLKVGSVIPQLYAANTGSFNNWCTSFLAPDSAKPQKSAGMDEELNDYALAVDTWSCMYSPQMAQDGNPGTAWCEGAEGDGIGETMVAQVNVAKPVRIWGGFGFSADYFQKNNRPKRVW